MRPSRITVQAPQLPSLQPSLVPVRPRMSRRHSSRLWRGSQRNSTASPLMVVRTRTLSCMAIVPPGLVAMAASSARRVSTAHRCRRYSAVPRMSVMGRGGSRWRCRGRARCSPALTGLPASASPASRTNSGVGATAARAMRAERKCAVFEDDRDARAGDRDIHFIARDEPQVARAGTRPRRRQDGARPATRRAARTVWPGAVQNSSTGSFARPAGPGDAATWRRSAISSGIASALGAALHRLPPIEARP